MKKTYIISYFVILCVLISACSKDHDDDSSYIPSTMSKEEILNLSPQDFINYLDKVNDQQKQELITQKLKLQKSSSTNVLSSNGRTTSDELRFPRQEVILDPEANVPSLVGVVQGTGDEYKWVVVESAFSVWQVKATGKYKLSTTSPKKLLSLAHAGTTTSGLPFGLGWQESYAEAKISTHGYAGYHMVRGTIASIIVDSEVENVCYLK